MSFPKIQSKYHFIKPIIKPHLLNQIKHVHLLNQIKLLAPIRDSIKYSVLKIQQRSIFSNFFNFSGKDYFGIPLNKNIDYLVASVEYEI